MTRLPGWYVIDSCFAMTPSSPAPSKRWNHSSATRGRACTASRAAGPSTLLNAALEPRAALGLRAVAEVGPVVARRSNATNDDGVSAASFATRDAAGWSRIWSASKLSHPRPR
jgi:hypothetical protein